MTARRFVLAVLLPVIAYINNIYAVDPKAGIVFLGDGGSGYGLYRFPASSTQPQLLLPRYGPSQSPAP